MAIALQTEWVTPADELRQLIAASEDGLVKLAGPASAAELFDCLDQIALLLPQFEATGADVRAENARWQGLQERILARGPQVLRAWQGADHLAAARQTRNPAASHWWWWIDQQVAEGRRRKLRRAATIALVTVAVVAVVGFVLSRLFPVDPAVRAAYRLQLEAESALGVGDLAAGSQLLQQAIQATPDNPTLLILYGAVADAQGDPAAAEQAWQRARELMQGAEAPFLTERGLAFLRVQQPDRAISDLEAAIALDPTSARAQLLLGSTLEAVGRFQEAIAAYEQAATLAQAAGNAELVATARVQMANLLQRLQASPAITPQP